MKINILLAILVVATGYLTCKNLQKTPVTPSAAPTAAVPPEQDPRNSLGWKASHVVEGDNPDAA